MTAARNNRQETAAREGGASASRAILYPRLSRVREEDLEGGARRQLHDHLRPLAARLGATVVAELGLADRSASRYATRIRKQYREAMEMIERGEADSIIFYDLSRLTRQPKELEDLIDRVERTGLKVYSATGELDLMTGEGRMIARHMVTAAAYEVDQTSKRVKDHRRAWDEAGLPPCGAAYGWVNARTPDSDESYWARWIVEQILRGESLTGIARALNDKQIPRHRSTKPWDCSTVGSVATTPRNYGLVLDKRGKPKRGSVDGFVARELYEQVLDALARRAVRAARPRRAGLLAGIVYCSRCELPMTASKRTNHSARPVLQCRTNVNTDRCGAGPIDFETVEKAITAAVFAWVDGTDLAALVSPSSPVDTEAINRRLDRLAAKEEKANRSWLDDVTSDEAHDDALRQIKAERDELVAALAQAARVTVLTEYAGKPGVLARAWPSLSVAVRRQVIVDALDLQHQRIVVDPPRPGPRPNRLDVAAALARIHWADETPAM